MKELDFLFGKWFGDAGCVHHRRCLQRYLRLCATPGSLTRSRNGTAPAVSGKEERRIPELAFMDVGPDLDRLQRTVTVTRGRFRRRCPAHSVAVEPDGRYPSQPCSRSPEIFFPVPPLYYYAPMAKSDLLRSHEELRGAIRVAGRETSKLHFGRGRFPVLQLMRRLRRESREARRRSLLRISGLRG